MATLKLSNLRLTGKELFNDSESFLADLQLGELQIRGGFPTSISISPLTYIILQEDISIYCPVTFPATVVTISK